MRNHLLSSNRSNLPIYLIRVAIINLMLAGLSHVFLPNLLASVAELLPFNSALISLISSRPGFNDEWRSIANLVTINGYAYIFIIVLLLLSLIFSQNHRFYQNSSMVLNPAFSRIFSPGLLLSPSKETLNDKEIGWATRKRINSILVDLIILLALTYLGYDSLSDAAVTGGIITRVLDAVLASYWSYCVFSIAFFLLFSVLQSFSFRKFK